MYLTIGELFVNSGGGISSNGGDLILSGTGDMGGTIGFSGIADFNNLTVNRTSTGIVHLGGGAQVDGTFYMQFGEVDLVSNLDIANNALVNR